MIEMGLLQRLRRKPSIDEEAQYYKNLENTLVKHGSKGAGIA